MRRGRGGEWWVRAFACVRALFSCFSCFSCVFLVFFLGGGGGPSGCKSLCVVRCALCVVRCACAAWFFCILVSLDRKSTTPPIISPWLQ